MKRLSTSDLIGWALVACALVACAIAWIAPVLPTAATFIWDTIAHQSQGDRPPIKNPSDRN